MALFKDEAPALGATTTVAELSGFGTGNPVLNRFKPTTREVMQVPLGTGATTSGWVYVAPWKCQVVAVKAYFTTASTSGTLQVANFTQAGQPQAPSTAPNGTTVVAQLSAPLSLAGTANTAVVGSLSTAAGSPTIVNAGDALAFQLAGTLTNLAGAYLQIEIVQIG